MAFLCFSWGMMIYSLTENDLLILQVTMITVYRSFFTWMFPYEINVAQCSGSTIIMLAAWQPFYQLSDFHFRLTEWIKKIGGWHVAALFSTNPPLVVLFIFDILNLISFCIYYSAESQLFSYRQTCLYCRNQLLLLLF